MLIIHSLRTSAGAKFETKYNNVPISMFSNPTTLPPDAGKWVAYAMILLIPGSFVVLLALWLSKLIAGKVRAIGSNH
jgi:hypothetical protein